MDESVILYPMSSDEKKENSQARKDLSHLKKYLARRINDENSLKFFENMSFMDLLFDLGFFPKAASSPDELRFQQEAKDRYLNAIRVDIKGSSAFFMKRKNSEIFINNYCPSLVTVLNSNHDIQLVLDPYAAANYITGYLTKNEGGISKLLKEIENSCKSLPKIDTIKRFGSALDKNREVSIQEIIYRLLGFPMAKFSTKVKYLNTCHPDYRDGLLKSNMDSLDENEEIFHFSPHQYYEKRPYEMEEMCLAEFWANTEICRKSFKANTVQPLLDNIGFIYSRNEPAVLRYYINYDDPLELARALLILFYPFRNEMQEIHNCSIMNLFNEYKEDIEIRRKKFEKNSNLVNLIEEIEKIKETEVNDDSENGEIEERLIMDETTSEFDIAKFVEESKKSALKNIEKPDDKSVVTIEDIRKRINTLNFEQQKIFTDIIERIASLDKEEEPFYLYIAGEAGVGKSYLLRVLIDSVKYLKMESGDELSKPKVLVLCPTANSAYIVNGQTIESGLGLNPNTRYNFAKLSADRHTNLKYLYDDLSVIFIDECSMVGSNKLAKIHLQLQMLSDGQKKDDFMGGKIVIVTGDMRQLPPVKDSYITERSTLDRRPLCAPSHWEQFRIKYLTEKMRSKSDEHFGAICDRVGKGEITDDDIKFFQSRVIPTDLENHNDNFKYGKICIITTTNKRRQEINNSKLELLLPLETTYECHSIDSVINMPIERHLSKDLPPSETGQLPTSLRIKKGAPVMLTCNHPKKIYKEDGICNGTSGFIEHIQTNPDNPDEVDIIWVIFNNSDIGSVYRRDHFHLRGNQNFLDKRATPIIPIKKRFNVKSGDVEYQRSMFPLTLSYAITAHKCQGITLEGGAITDFADGYIQNGSFYVAITRVKSGDKLFLRSFDVSFIKCNKDMEAKITSMRIERPYVYKKTFLDESVFDLDKNDMKIGYLNVNSLLEALHDECINFNYNMRNLDLLCLSDTRLTASVNNDEALKNLSNWEMLSRFDCPDQRKHMGLLILTPKGKKVKERKIKVLSQETVYSPQKGKQDNVLAQLINVQINDRRLTFIYVRISPTMDETKIICSKIETSSYILGDLNLDPNREGDESKLSYLCGKERRLHLKDITTIGSFPRQLDHIIVRNSIKHLVISDCWYNFLSDHKYITLRITGYANDKPLLIPKNVSLENVNENLINVKKELFVEPDYVPQQKKVKKEITWKDSDYEKTSEMYLSSLKGERWLTNFVIDDYLALLQSYHKDTFIFSTHFTESFFYFESSFQSSFKVLQKCKLIR